MMACARVCNNVLSAVCNAALDDAFALAVLGKKAGAIHEKVCAIVASIAPAVQQQQQHDDPLLPLLAAIREERQVQVSYQSMSSTEPGERTAQTEPRASTSATV